MVFSCCSRLRTTLVYTIKCKVKYQFFLKNQLQHQPINQGSHNKNFVLIRVWCSINTTNNIHCILYCSSLSAHTHSSSKLATLSTISARPLPIGLNEQCVSFSGRFCRQIVSSYLTLWHTSGVPSGYTFLQPWHIGNVRKLSCISAQTNNVENSLDQLLKYNNCKRYAN